MDLKLGHYSKDGIEVVDVEGEIDIYTAPRLRELLIDLASKNNYQLIVNLDKVGFLDSTGLGVLVGGLKRVRPHDGSLDLVCTQERILKIFRITGLTKVFGIYQTRGPGHRGQEVSNSRRVRASPQAPGHGARSSPAPQTPQRSYGAGLRRALRTGIRYRPAAPGPRPRLRPRHRAARPTNPAPWPPQVTGRARKAARSFGGPQSGQGVSGYTRGAPG